MKRGVRSDHRKEKKSIKIAKRDKEEEIRLEQQLFGALDELTTINKIIPKHTSPLGISPCPEEPEEIEELNSPNTRFYEGQAAWVDDEDALDEKVSLVARDRLRKLREQPDEKHIAVQDFEHRLRKRFHTSCPQTMTDWAMIHPDQKSGSDEDDDETDLFRRALRDSRPLVKDPSQQNRMHPGRIDITRLKNANIQEPSKAVVQTVKFHPDGDLLLTAGFDKTLRFFKIDGNANPKVHGIYFPDLPISSAAFTGSGDHVIVSGRRPFFYWYDIQAGTATKVPRIFGHEEKSLERFVASPDGQWLAFTGRNGYSMLLSNRTKQWVADFKMNGKCKALAFSPDSKRLLTTGTDADVYEWDLRSSKCVSKFHDEGGTKTCALAVSSQTPWKYTATGSESGVVNIYNNQEKKNGSPTLLKAVMNLTTEIHAMAFNCDSQVLAITSRVTKDALKLVHLPTCTVFSNWPSERTPIGYASCIDFSPNGGLLSVGNAKGYVLLYRIKHYSNS